MGQFSKKNRTFYQKKLSLSSQKYGFGIQDPEKTYSGSRIQGVKGQKGTGSQIRIRNTAIAYFFPFFYSTLSLCALTTPCHFFLSFVLSLWSVTVCLTYFNLASLFLIRWFLLNLGLKFLHPYFGTCMYNSCPHLDAWTAGEDRFSSSWVLRWNF